MKRWRYPLVSLVYVLPPFLWDSFFERMSSFGLIFFWALLVLAGAVNMLFLHKLSVVKSGVISTLLAGLLIGVTFGAVNWSPVNFNLLRELVYVLAPLFMLYPPIERMLKKDKKENEHTGAKNGNTESLIN
ncbi:hypothetical protein ACFQ1X_13805 [Metaplanococcus flavidus]|uniref:Uncharacterized protein n=2 Tax=Metaplanococcus flavidus TaxID=569883 RepID=A0ABW3LEN4_9BACL